MPTSSDPSERNVLSVSALVDGLARVVETAYDDVRVEGELSNFHRAASGHCYFTLKDHEAQIRCVMWRYRAKDVFFDPADGQQIRVRGSASIYERRGDLQIMVESMQMAGKGALQEAFERLKQQLADEGLFDAARKQPIPAFPETIGIVTSGQGAALHDITSILERRFPVARAVLCPVPVQGMDAPRAIADAIAAFNAVPAEEAARPDVLIVGRGGGSVEDLWSFNEEVVARAIAASDLPVISAVGHETDVSIADLVADERAATPSMAAEIAVPDRHEVATQLHTLHERLQGRVAQHLHEARQSVVHLVDSRAFHRPVHRLQQHRQALDGLLGRLERAGSRLAHDHRNRLEQLQSRLRALDPEGPLRRGYALVERDGEPVRRAAALPPSETVTLRFLDGTRPARTLASPDPSPTNGT